MFDSSGLRTEQRQAVANADEAERGREQENRREGDPRSRPQEACHRRATPTSLPETMTASTPARSSSITSERLAPASSAMASLPAGMSGRSSSRRSRCVLVVVCLLGREQEDLRDRRARAPLRARPRRARGSRIRARARVPPRSRRRARPRARSRRPRARRRLRPRAPWPNASSGRSVLSRRPSSRRRTTSPSAPCSWAALAPPPSTISTSTEIPSPSAIAWLSRRAPVIGS